MLETELGSHLQVAVLHAGEAPYTAQTPEESFRDAAVLFVEGEGVSGQRRAWDLDAVLQAGTFGPEGPADPLPDADLVLTCRPAGGAGPLEAWATYHVMVAVGSLPQLAPLKIAERIRLPHLDLQVRKIEAYPDAEDAFDVLFRSSARAVWLDSSNAETAPQPRNRFSILADDSGSLGMYVTHFSGMTTVSSAQLQVRVRSPFFNWLAGAWDKVLEPAPGAFPSQFALGWLGYLGYELKRETGGAVPLRAVSFARYRAPDAALIFASRAVVIDHAERCSYIMSLVPGGPGLDTGSWQAGAAAALHRLSRIRRGNRRIACSTDDAAPVGRTLQFRCLDDEQQYLGKILAAKSEITNGNSYEVCLTTQLVAEPEQPVEPWQVYRLLRRHNPAPFAAYLAFDSLRIASTSPERFLQIDSDGLMTAEPIKGTRPRHADPVIDRALREALASSEKDRAENIMIVDLMRNDLSRSAEPESVQVERLCAIESYATVHQMVSTISAKLRFGIRRAHAVAAAFPAGSMTGAPKPRTMAILDGLEAGTRGVYSGAIGYFSANGACDLSVVIRTLVIDQPADGEGTPRQCLSLGIGGAITADSVPAAEYEEIQDKARGVLKALGTVFPQRNPGNCRSESRALPSSELFSEVPGRSV
ncbi:aminodeoxychorismate synthase component I [Arthrobacter mangrovi]|nr:aminodeoxychorismate synthase component I [Arthrobacter mangrovi]